MKKMIARTRLLVSMLVCVAWGQRPLNCDTGCGGTTPAADLKRRGRQAVALLMTVLMGLASLMQSQLDLETVLLVVGLLVAMFAGAGAVLLLKSPATDLPPWVMQPARALGVALLLVCGSVSAFAQRPPNCDMGCGGITPPAQGSGGGPILTSTSITNVRGMGSPTVATRRVGKSTALEGSQSYSYAVNLFSLPGRNGLNLNLTLYYNSLVWEFNSDNGSMVYGAFDNPSPGFRLDYGLLQFASDLSLGMLTEPNGAKHLFVPTGTAGQYTTQDSSYILVQYPATSGNPAIVTYKNGLKAFFQLFDTTYPYQYRPYQIEDTNGNIIAITYLNSNGLGINTITDTVGRVIQFTYDSTGKMLQSVAQLKLNSNGAVLRQYNFTWAANQVINFNFTSPATAGLGLPPGNLTSGQTTENLLTGVTRPDGTQVAFSYFADTTGGFDVNPDWGIVKNIQEKSSNGTPRYITHYTFPAATAGALTSNPTYTQQIMDDRATAGVWNFQATKDTNGMVTCFATLDQQSRLSTTTFSNNGDAFDGLPVQHTLSTISPNTSFSGCQTAVAKTWRTAIKTWTTDAGGNMLPASVTTVLEDGATQSQVKFNGYDSFGQVTDMLQYDFGASQPGPLLREAVTTYAGLSNNIANRPAELKVKDGAGNVVSDTKFNYDETAVVAANPLPTSGTHDEANYSASGTNARGNLTSIINYTNAAGVSGAITSRFTHDEFGNTISSNSGCCAQSRQTFSLTTQYAYTDTISVGPSAGQLTTTYTWDMDRGVGATVTDPNGQATNLTHDVDDRLSTLVGPDGITSTTTYDDASATPSFSISNTANSLVAKIVADGLGHPLSRQMLNVTTSVSTTGFTNDITGQVLQATNPYGPSDSIVNTTYTYDPLGRILTATPPAISGASQHSYQTQYAAAKFTDVFGFTKSGQSVTTTDPAGNKRLQYLDVLGHLVRVDEPGPTGGQAGGSGSVSISGTEQSASVANGSGATAGTGSVTFAGSERSTVVLTHAASAASVTVTIGGADGTDSVTVCTRTCRTFTHQDTGTLQFTANSGGTTVGPVSASYGGGSTPASLAAALYAAFPANSVVTMSNPNGSASFTLSTIATGSATNSSTITTAINDNCVNSDTTSCSEGLTITPTENFTGGSDNVFTTFYDTGTVTVSVTINGTVYSKSINYSQNTGSLADLANQINSDTTLNHLLVASASTSVLNLTTTATGAGTAYPLSASVVTTSPYFPPGSSSYTATPSGATLTPGQNGTVYDTGTVTVSITSFTATPMKYTANYSQGSTSNTIASAIAGAINADRLAPVNANVATGSNVVTLTSKTLGSDTNYGVSATSATSLGANFSQPSFNGSGAPLSGGTDAVVSLTTPLITFAGYDAMGNLGAVSQGQQNRKYVYDSLGRMTSSCVPETNNQCTTFTYTDFGAIATKVDPRGITTTYTYDSFNRLQTIAYSDGTPTVTYTYGPAGAGNYAAGRLTNLSSSSAADAYTYDNMGRLTQCVKTIGGQNYTIAYHYSNEQLDYMTYPSGRIVYHDHDAIGRLSQVRSGGTTVLSIGSSNGPGYNAAGEILNTVYGNGMTGAYTYNNQLQLNSILASKSGTPVLNLAYNYGGANDNGQISGITDGVTAAQSTSYVYDELGRLKVAQTTDLSSANTWKLKFSYDRYGNRISQIPAAGTAAMPLSEVSVDPTTNRLTNLVYDADGNVVNDNQHTYTYNGANQITSVAGTNNTYAYDGGGLRVNKNGKYYIYSGGQLIAEYANGAAAGSPTAEYIYAGNKRVATVVAGAITYHYWDHLSIRSSFDSSGNVVRTYGHFPFGETWYETGTPNQWKFTTYENDSESGLNYAHARFQSPALGRFMSIDPWPAHHGRPQSWNRYHYGANNPISFVDPSGQDDECDVQVCFVDPGGDPLLGGNEDAGGSSLDGGSQQGAGPGTGNGGDCQNMACNANGDCIMNCNPGTPTCLVNCNGEPAPPATSTNPPDQPPANQPPPDQPPANQPSPDQPPTNQPPPDQPPANQPPPDQPSKPPSDSGGLSPNTCLAIEAGGVYAGIAALPQSWEPVGWVLGGIAGVLGLVHLLACH
jgi:RHS repeat-associated protein